MGDVRDRDRFIAFAFTASDLLVETDAPGVVGYAAGTVGRFLPRDVAVADLVGRPFSTLLGEPDRALLRLLLAQIEDGGRRGPVAVTNARGDVAAECSLLHRPGEPRYHLVLRRLPEGRPGAGLDGRDGRTGLLDGEAFGEFAEQEFLRLVRTDRELELSLVRLVGLEHVAGGLDGEQGRALVARLAAALRAASLGGQGAAQLAGDRFAVLHGDDAEAARLDDLLAHELDAAGLDGVRVERRALPVGETSLSPAQACAALRYTLDAFAAGADVAFDDLGDALGRKVADTAARVAEAKAVVDSRAFFVLYQPIVALTDGRVHHHEALTRLRERGRGIYEFVTFAETIGFVSDFDLAVLREVLDKLATMRRRRRKPEIAVNLSARSLSNDAFIDRVLELGHHAGANARQVLFEVTESFQLVDLTRADAVIQRLRRAGHRVCLDDFGAGAAAFHYIRALDVDYVKLDGAFVQNVLVSERDRAVLAGMIELCRSLGVATVAEMVETADQAEDLRRLGVDYAQGHLFGTAVAEPVESVGEA